MSMCRARIVRGFGGGAAGAGGGADGDAFALLKLEEEKEALTTATPTMRFSRAQWRGADDPRVGALCVAHDVRQPSSSSPSAAAADDAGTSRGDDSMVAPGPVDPAREEHSAGVILFCRPAAADGNAGDAVAATSTGAAAASAAAAATAADDVQVLVIQHGGRTGAGGHWGFPKGHVEDADGGVLLVTALRELEEEAGVSPETLRSGEATIVTAAAASVVASSAAAGDESAQALTLPLPTDPSATSGDVSSTMAPTLDTFYDFQRVYKPKGSKIKRRLRVYKRTSFYVITLKPGVPPPAVVPRPGEIHAAEWLTPAQARVKLDAFAPDLERALAALNNSAA